MRWLVPSAAAVLVIGGGAIAGTIVASADPSLPERSAAQLLVDVQNAKVDGLSGTVVQRADLGLPALSGLGAGANDLMKLVTGNNTVRVWYAGEDKARVAVLSTLGETDIIRNGTDVWLWNSRENTATNYKVPADLGKRTPEAKPTALPSAEIPSTPADAAALALAAIDPTTAVTTTGAAKVAGRDAYELVLSPKDTASLVGEVRLAIDAKTHIPLRVDVFPRGGRQPAVRVGFEQVTFAVPDDEQFAFNPPPGAKIETKKADATADVEDAVRTDKLPNGRKPVAKGPSAADEAGAEPTVVGKGWTSIVVAKVPTANEIAKAEKAEKPAGTGVDDVAPQLDLILGQLPKVSGTWGSGKLLATKLFTVLLTDDGRVLAGAVTPEKLYETAATTK
jgi:outer membrane lipoprotein-sorting protein